MARQSNGSYIAPANTTAVAGTTIKAAPYNSLNTDLGNEITNSVDRLGRGGMQADLPLGNHKVTGAIAGVAATDLATVAQVQSSVVSLAAVVAGTADAITANFNPTLTVLTAGMRLRWISTGPNTVVAPTINFDTLGALTIVKGVSSALLAGDTGASGYPCEMWAWGWD